MILLIPIGFCFGISWFIATNSNATKPTSWWKALIRCFIVTSPLALILTYFLSNICIDSCSNHPLDAVTKIFGLVVGVTTLPIYAGWMVGARARTKTKPSRH